MPESGHEGRLLVTGRLRILEFDDGLLTHVHLFVDQSEHMLRGSESWFQYKHLPALLMCRRKIARQVKHPSRLDVYGGRNRIQSLGLTKFIHCGLHVSRGG